MKIFRWIAYSIPQLLILLILGGRFDLLYGLNHTDAGFMLLIVVFVASPVVSMLLMIIELIRYFHRRHRERRLSFLMPGISIFLMIEALMLEVFILSLVRM
jgi:hypothetical protein